MVLVTLSKIVIILVVSGPLGKKRLVVYFIIVTDIVSCLCGFNISPGNVGLQLDGTAAEFF